MKTEKTVRRSVCLLAICAALLSFMLAGTAVCYAETAPEFQWEDVKIMSHCDVEIEGNTLVVTDTEFNEDVWDSKFLIDAGVDLEPGEPYTISFELEGDEGVGEFFLCKGETMDIRYDETFTSEGGNRTIAFTPVADRVYIGMQVGNLGMDEYVTVTVTNLCKLSESEDPALLRAENCALSIKDGEITATDNNDNNDVWNSKVLYDPGFELEVGKTYTLNVDLRGDNGVGEFFLCRSQDLNDRYDNTFLNVPGSKALIFKAESDKAYIGMQFGNAGNGHSVTARFGEVRDYVPAVSSKSADDYECKEYEVTSRNDPRVIRAQNSSYEVNISDGQTVINAADTSEEKDVWTSKVLYFLGELLEKGKCYAANFNLAGDNGVGEFFFLKKDDMDNRYSFDNTPGDHQAKFMAEDTKLYAGLQLGNIGKGNSMTVDIREVFNIPGLQKSSENCEESVSLGAVTITDTDDNPDVWNSKAVYETGIALEPGKTYTATFTLSGANGVGEFFFLKSDNIDERYSFDNTSGDHTITFTADGTALYFGIQCGNIGNGNSVTVSNITVTPDGSEEPMLMQAFDAPEEVLDDSGDEDADETEQEEESDEAVDETEQEDEPAAARSVEYEYE